MGIRRRDRWFSQRYRWMQTPKNVQMVRGPIDAVKAALSVADDAPNVLKQALTTALGQYREPIFR